MNWGQKIIVVYAVFVAGMILLAYKSFNQETELVTEDYYAKELVYQQKIDETKRAAMLSAPIKVLIEGPGLSIEFPKDFAGEMIAGNINLYCPANEKKDIHQPFNITDRPLIMPLPATNRGLHYVKISWVTAGVSYYFEKKIII